MDIFDVLGPVMIGPSSSHTAGAVKIGKAVKQLLGEKAVSVKFTLYGSFAYTYKGHGTDKALAAGIMGFDPDDFNIRESLKIAKEKEIYLSFITSADKQNYANTVLIHAKGLSNSVCVKAASTGAGNILLIDINGFPVEAPCVLHTLIIPHIDIKGVVAHTAVVLANQGMNIAGMKVYRNNRGGQAVMVIETDEPVECGTLKLIENIKNVINTVYIPPV